MTQEAFAAPAPEFRIGRVLSVSLQVLRRNLAPFLLLSLICSIPRILYLYENPAVQRALNGTTALPSAADPWNRVALILVGLVVSTLSYAMAQSALIFGTIQDLSGQRASFGEIVSRGFSSLFPVLGAALVISVGYILGLVLLIVPGFILLCMWWVAIPALVTERSGIRAAFARSRQLTAGRRWAILGLFLLVVVVQQGLAYLVGGIAGAIFASHGLSTVVVAGLLGGMIVGFVFVAYYAVMGAVGYYYLRAEKEGIAIGDIARVFD